MQSIYTYVRVSATKGTAVDSYNNMTVDAPQFTLCLNAEMKLKLFHSEDADSAFTQSELSGYTLKFYADNAWNGASQKVSTESGITVGTDGVLTIPFDTGGADLISYVGSQETVTLHGELQGYGEGSYAELIVQFDVTVRNRVKR